MSIELEKSEAIKETTLLNRLIKKESEELKAKMRKEIDEHVQRTTGSGYKKNSK